MFPPRRLLLCALALSAGLPASAAFQAPLQSGQSAAMAGTGLAREGDSAAVFANPSQLAGLKPGTKDAYFSYTNMFSGMSGTGHIGSGFLAGAVPALGGTVGAGVATFDAAGLKQERTVSVGYARALGRLSVGLSGKFLHHSYKTDGDALAAQDPVFRSGSSRGAFAVDTGLSYKLTDELKVGVAVLNLNRPDVGLDSVDPVTRQVRLSASYMLQGYNLTADVTKSDEDGVAGRAQPSLGVEKWLSEDRVAFRAGVGQNTFSAGVGLRFGEGMMFDYAFTLNRQMLQDSFGTHTIGLRVAFGGSSK